MKSLSFKMDVFLLHNWSQCLRMRTFLDKIQILFKRIGTPFLKWGRISLLLSNFSFLNLTDNMVKVIRVFDFLSYLKFMWSKFTLLGTNEVQSPHWALKWSLNSYIYIFFPCGYSHVQVLTILIWLRGLKPFNPFQLCRNLFLLISICSEVWHW